MKTHIKMILSYICKATHDICSATMFLFIELLLWLVNIDFKTKLLFALASGLFAILLSLVTFLELPLLLLGIALEKILSKNRDP